MLQRYTRGAAVTCSDGDLGDLLDLITNEWDDVTHLVVRSWDEPKAVVIPVDLVSDVDPNRITLATTREEVRRLPSRPLTSTEALHGGYGARET